MIYWWLSDFIEMSGRKSSLWSLSFLSLFRIVTGAVFCGFYFEERREERFEFEDAEKETAEAEATRHHSEETDEEDECGHFHHGHCIRWSTTGNHTKQLFLAPTQIIVGI